MKSCNPVGVSALMNDIPLGLYAMRLDALD
jgi:hypothetical protein